MSSGKEAASAVALHDVLQRCFFIHDSLAACNDDDDPEEMIVYFHPSELSIEFQLHVIGSIKAMADFALKFTKALPTTFRMQNEKAAYRCVGRYAMVLFGSVFEKDISLTNQLDNLYDVFCFFNGTFDNVWRRCGSDSTIFLPAMKNIWSKLVPLIKCHDNLVNPTFNSIPYADLPPLCNRYFIMASQLLNQLHVLPGVLGGCVIYNHSILCTHLDSITTRWVLAYVAMSNNSTTGARHTSGEAFPRNSSISDEGRDGAESDMLGLGDLLSVYLKNSEVNRLRDWKYCNVNTTRESDLSQRNLDNNLDETTRMSLYLRILPMVTLAAICSTCDETEAVNSIQSHILTKLMDFEVKIENTVVDIPPTVGIPNVGGGGGHENSTTSSSTTSVGNVGSSGMNHQLGHDLRDPFNYISFDFMSKSSFSTPLDLRSILDDSFLCSVTAMHDTYELGRKHGLSPSSITLSDYISTVYSCQTFNHETFFQIRNNAAIAYFDNAYGTSKMRDLSKVRQENQFGEFSLVEETAAMCLRRVHGIYLF